MEPAPEEFIKKLLDCKRPMRGYAWQLTKNHHDAEDLVGDVILKAIENHKTYDMSKPILSWLGTIMHNRFIDLTRRNENKLKKWTIDLTPYPSEEDNTDVLEQRISEKYYSENEAFYNITAGKIEQFLKKKENKELKLWMDGYLLQEIADELETNIEVVKSRIYRSRFMLQSALPGESLKVRVLRRTA